MRKLIYLFAFLMIFFTSCEKEESTPEDDTGNPIGNERPLTGEATIIGIVYDQDGLEMPGVNVTCGAVTFTTNEKGRFQLDNAPEGEDIIVDFQLDGYMRTQKTLESVKDGERLVIATMYPVGKVTKVSGEDGGMAEHAGMRVEFPANAFVTSDGEPYTGEAEVEITFVPTSTDRFAEIFPGDFEGLREDGTMTFVESYGFADINITAEGKELRLADNKKATLSYPINSKQKTDAPSTIPLWYYDYEQGQWIEEGSATMQGGMYVGEVSHFTPWNVDVPRPTTCTLSGRVVDDSGNPLEDALVTVLLENTRSWRLNMYTDTEGKFSATVLENIDIMAFASYYELTSDIKNATMGSANSTNDIGDLIINLSTEFRFGETEIVYFDANTEIDDAYFVDCQTGYFAEIGNTYNGSIVTINKTVDGGGNWNEFEFAYEGNVNTPLPLTHFHFINTQKGLFSINETLYMTENGGESWNRILFPNPEGEMIRSIKLNQNGDIELFTGDRYLSSKDMGESFEELSLSVFGLYYSESMIVSGFGDNDFKYLFLNGSSSQNNNYMYYNSQFKGFSKGVVSNPHFSVSERIISPKGEAGGYISYDYLDAFIIRGSKNILVGAEDGIWESVDGGRDFELIKAINLTSRLMSFAAEDGTLWVSYESGTVVHENRDGTRIDTYHLPKNTFIRRFFVFDGCVYGLNDENMIYKFISHEVIGWL